MSTMEKIVAWWGAVLSTALFLWDIYKWKTAGPKIEFSVSPNMNVLGFPEREGSTYITVRATNTGDRSTTITTLSYRHYKTLLHRLAQKPAKSFVVVRPGATQPIPFELKPGGIWDGLALQDEKIEQMAKSGHLVVELYCSHSPKPISRRVVIKN